MIFFIEGLSATGKTTLINKYLEKYPNNGAIRFKGSGAVNIGMQSRWQEYNFWMHNIIERMDQLNDYKVPFLWDRGITDIIYSEDENYATELLRVVKSHIRKAVIYIDAPPSTLNRRMTKEGSDMSEHGRKYEHVIKSFDILRITLSGDCLITEEHVDMLHEYIMSKI
jgi:thymidylate kinase